MSKTKLYIIGFLVVLFFGMGITIKIIVKNNKTLKAENSRVLENNLNLMAENRQIINLKLRDKEVIGKLAKERDSLAKALQIKPKQIERIIYVDVYTRDTIKINVPVYIVGKDTWIIKDSSKCFKWQGVANKLGDSLNITRTLYENTNKITETFYRVRPHKILCIRFGKWVYKQKIDATCGKVIEQNIEFLK
jgi:hypothetical protein